jgi:hypothetical protein
MNEQKPVIITSHPKLKIQIKASKGYEVKDLLAHFTLAQLQCKYNFEIKIWCIHIYTASSTNHALSSIHLTVESISFLIMVTE